MSQVQLIPEPLRRFLTFKGTARRLEFALILFGPFFLYVFLIFIVALWQEFFSIPDYQLTRFWDGLSFLALVYYLTFGVTVFVRRVHDLGHPGVLVFIFFILSLIPFINIFVAIYLFLQPGKKTDNPYLTRQSET